MFITYNTVDSTVTFNGMSCILKKKLSMKTIHYPNEMRYPIWSQSYQWRSLLQHQLQS